MTYVELDGPTRIPVPYDNLVDKLSHQIPNTVRYRTVSQNIFSSTVVFCYLWYYGTFIYYYVKKTILVAFHLVDKISTKYFTWMRNEIIHAQSL